MVVADVKCYHCGYVSGELTEEYVNAIRVVRFRPARDYPRPVPRPGEGLRCGRCGGPVYLDEVRTVRHRPVEAIPKERRRRKWTRRRPVGNQLVEGQLADRGLPEGALPDSALRESELAKVG